MLDRLKALGLGLLERSHRAGDLGLASVDHLERTELLHHHALGLAQPLAGGGERVVLVDEPEAGRERLL